jgi:hypothetical protein
MQVGQVATVDALGTSCSAWLSPRGDWHYTGECGHYDAALVILAGLGIPCDPDCYDDPIRMLEESGWAHVSYGEVITHTLRVTTSQSGALAEGISHVIRSGMVTPFQRAFVTNASYHVD